MIDLRNTRILVVTPEENEKLLKEAEKQGFHWYLENDCKPLQGQHFPDILKFYDNKEVVHSAYRSSGDDTFYEASELLNTKEMTAREFAEWIADAGDCCERKCTKCVLDHGNTSVTRVCALHGIGKATLTNFSKLRHQAELQFLYKKKRLLIILRN